MTQGSWTSGTDLFKAQLFLDDGWIADHWRLTRVWHQARKYPEPVLRSEYPWEHNCPVLYGTVLRRNGRFQMWYCGWTRTEDVQPRVCYAESQDGVHWEKPSLGLYEFKGRKSNNIIFQSESPQGLIDDISVIEDDADAAWPLKALYWDSGDPRKRAWGIHAARSRDGISWESLGMVLPGWGDRFNAAPVRIDGKFHLLGRAPGGISLEGTGRGRVVSLTVSEDLCHWSEPRLVLKPDVEDPPLMQFYSATAFPYESLLLGSIERMYTVPDKLDTEIIWSRDGWVWNRSRSRTRFIEWGVPGSFDTDWLNLPTNGPIVNEHGLWFYYSGRTGAHGVQFPVNQGVIGLATLRIDGFCSLQAMEVPGAALTKPLTWVDGDLLVNVDPRRDVTAHPTDVSRGWLRVEARDHDNQTIEGYGLDECIPLSRNTGLMEQASASVRWQGNRSLRDLRGMEIRLFFELKDAHLYSFRAGTPRE